MPLYLIVPSLGSWPKSCRQWISCRRSLICVLFCILTFCLYAGIVLYPYPQTPILAFGVDACLQHAYSAGPWYWIYVWNYIRPEAIVYTQSISLYALFYTCILKSLLLHLTATLARCMLALQGCGIGYRYWNICYLSKSVVFLFVFVFLQAELANEQTPILRHLPPNQFKTIRFMQICWFDPNKSSVDGVWLS